MVFAYELQRQLLARSEALDDRERRLDEREGSLKSLERLLPARTRPLELPANPSVGRNDPCPCRSGLKYKRAAAIDGTTKREIWMSPGLPALLGGQCPISLGAVADLCGNPWN